MKRKSIPRSGRPSIGGNLSVQISTIPSRIEDDIYTFDGQHKQIRFQTESRTSLQEISDDEKESQNINEEEFKSLVSLEEVKESLERKFNVDVDSSSSFSDESSHEGVYFVDDGTSSTSHRTKEPLHMVGQLCVEGPSELVKKTRKKHRFRASVYDEYKPAAVTRATSMLTQIGISYSFTHQEVWPWPWLDPELKSAVRYVSPIYGLVTFDSQEEVQSSRLPILAQTLKCYLDTVEPCVTQTQLSNTRKIVKMFAQCHGKRLHGELLSMELGRTPWHRKVLPNYDFRKSRQDQVLQNLAIIMPLHEDVWPEKAGTQIDRSVELISLTLEFFLLIFKERLKPLRTENNLPLCMHSFRKLFSTSRIPAKKIDLIESYFTTRASPYENTRHIVIIHKGRYFAVNILDNNDYIINQKYLKQQLNNIIDMTEATDNIHTSEVGLFTSSDRDVWHENRKALIDFNIKNSENIRVLDEALFVLGLESVSVQKDWLGREAVFGDGCNRWFDKSLCFSVFRNGLITCTVNNAVHDGWCTAVLLDYIHIRVLEDMQKWEDDIANTVTSKINLLVTPTRSFDHIYQVLRKGYLGVTSAQSVDNVIKYRSISEKQYKDIELGAREIKFELNDELSMELTRLNTNYQKLRNSLSTAECSYYNFDKDMLREKNISPNGFAHLIIHLVFFQMYYRICSVGTKIQTKTFYHGRYDILRSSTKEVRDWCVAMLNPDENKGEKNRLFWLAEKKHRFFHEKCLAGQGCDTHLIALKNISVQMDMKTPELFLDKSYAISGSDNNFEMMIESFGEDLLSRRVVLPCTDKGYGIGYSVVNSRLCLTVSSWQTDIGSSAQMFATSMEKTLELYRDFFTGL